MINTTNLFVEGNWIAIAFNQLSGNDMKDLSN